MRSTQNHERSWEYLGIIFVGFVLSKSMVLAPVHEFAHVVAALLTGLKVTDIGWMHASYDGLNAITVLVAFPAELFAWSVLVWFHKSMYVKSFFFGAAVDTAHTGGLSADYNSVAEYVVGMEAASVARLWWSILSVTVVLILGAKVFKSWMEERYVRQKHEANRRHRHDRMVRSEGKAANHGRYSSTG